MQGSQFYSLFSTTVRSIFQSAKLDLEKLQEVRMRTGQPLLLRYGGREYALTGQGMLAEDAMQGFRITKEQLCETLEYVSGYSLYAFDEEMKQGFITVPGGHRIGISGRIVTEGGKIQCIRHISFINIRLSHQIRGCADRVLPHLISDGELCHTLIVSPPGCGKTTLLRDIIRQISTGTHLLPGRTVGVVDERSEIAGCYLGVPQNDIGIRTDVLDCCAKAEGMTMLLRSMAPRVIAVDELGGDKDLEAVEKVFHCGCRLLATVHGSSVAELSQSPMFGKMMRQKMFERYILLGRARHAGYVKAIYDAQERILYQEEE